MLYFVGVSLGLLGYLVCKLAGSVRVDLVWLVKVCIV